MDTATSSLKIALTDLANVGASSTIPISNGTALVSQATSTLGLLGGRDLSGDVTGTQAGAITIAANAVALGTDTTGNFVATVAPLLV